MEDMQNNSFATCGDALLFDRPHSIKIMSGSLPERTSTDTRIPGTKREFMEAIKQALLAQRFQDPAEKERDSVCEICRDNNTEAFLFPTCRMAHSFGCEGCIPEILKNVGGACRFPGCKNDNFLEEECEKTAEQHRTEWIENGGAILVQPQAIDLLTLAIPEIITEPVLLERETTVTLENIALSDALLFKLLEKTDVVAGDNVSVFGNFRGEDCVREGTEFEGLYFLRPVSFPRVEDSNLFENTDRFMKNIAQIANRSIRLGRVETLQLNSFATSIFPKLVLHEESEMEMLHLSADQSRYVENMERAGNRSIWVGKVKRLELEYFAVCILPKLLLHKENVMEMFRLHADKLKHVRETIFAENNIWLGKVKGLELAYFSTSILPKLVLHEENEMEMFRLSTGEIKRFYEVILSKKTFLLGKEERQKIVHAAIKRFYEEMGKQNENVMDLFCMIFREKRSVPERGYTESNTIWLGKVRNMELRKHAINILQKLRLHPENCFEKLSLSAWRAESISELTTAENSSIWLGKVRKLELESFAANLLPKLKLHKDNVMESLCLRVLEAEHVSGIRCTKNIWLGRVRRLELGSYATSLLPKLVLHKENVPGERSLGAEEKEYLSEIKLSESNSINLLHMKKHELDSFVANTLPNLMLHEGSGMDGVSMSVLEMECGELGVPSESLAVGE
ncbi:MAG: uncharacterized protein A8A55_2577 [Amphiamblys sp. WSBS2006]|nr:MAG: uncharacterized protein A8A55_2577 [Amphiamblys sp. WSBS2006]